MRKSIIIAAMALCALPALAQQAPKYPRQSPRASVMQTVGITDVTVQYSRPGVRGREIFGALVPYDKVWRTGANEATTVNFSDDVWVGGTKLPKGLYSLHTIPGKDEWTVIFNTVAEQWGSYSYDESKDAVRVKVKPAAAPQTEWLTFEFTDLTNDTGNLVLRWDDVAVPVAIDTKSTERALTNAKNALGNAWQTPYAAADFALNAGRMEEAEKWTAQAIAANENIATLYLKARLLQKQGKTAEAIATAEKAIAAANGNEAFAGEIRRVSSTWK